MSPSEIRRALNSLFNRARAADEFEYACTLLRVRGLEAPGWDRLEETQALTQDLLALLQAPLQPHTRVRLGLLLYCHLTEVDPIYIILDNMLRAIDGDRYSMDPFHALRRGSVPPSASRVVTALCAHARRSRRRKLAEILEWEFNDAVRNAFFHSDYILHDAEFRSTEGMFVQPDGTRSPVLTFDQLQDLINRGLLFYQVFMDVFVRHIFSYERDKPVEGRFAADGSAVPITLRANPERGLYGFESTSQPGSGAN